MDEALRSVNLAMEKGSENRDLWSLKGKVHFIRQEFKEAEMALSKAPDSDRATWMRPLLPKLISMKKENKLLSLESMEWFMEQISDKGYVYPICMYAASKASTLDEAFKISMLSVKHFRLNSAVKDWSYNYEVTGEALSVDLSSLTKLRSIKGLEFLPISELNNFRN